MKILFLGANGLDTSRLQIAAELRKVKGEIERAEKRKNIQVIAELAARPEDLSRLLHDFEPDVVHFSGHGARIATPSRSPAIREFDAAIETDIDNGKIEGGEKPAAILLENEEGSSVEAQQKALTRLFGTLGTRRCVVLNACLTAELAKELTKHVDCVIGMQRKIDDRSAIAFSLGFYQTLVRGKNIEQAFDVGKSLIGISGLPDTDVPTLYCREGVDPKKVRLVSRRRAWGRSIILNLVMLGVLAVLLGFGVWIAIPARFPTVTALSGVIMVAGPGSWSSNAKSATDALCEALDQAAHGSEPRTICRRRGYWESDVSLRKTAIEADASALVAVDDDGKGHLYPLGNLENQAPLDLGLPVVDLLRDEAPKKWAPIVRDWARAADMDSTAELDDARRQCGKTVEQEQLGIALSAMLLWLRPRVCWPAEVNIDPLKSQCRNDECVIVRWLEGQAQAIAAKNPAHCEGISDENARLGCFSKLAWEICPGPDAREALRMLKEIEAVQQSSYAVTASSLAACILAHFPAAAAGQKEALEVTAKKTEDTTDLFYAATVAQRAGHWAYAKDWKQAQQDYEWSFQRLKDNESLFGIVASRLHRHKDFNAHDLRERTAADLKPLKSTQSAQPSTPHEVRAALMQWVAAKREGNATHLETAEASVMDTYDRLPTDAQVYPTRDDTERGLVCPEGAKDCAVCDLLEEHKRPEMSSKLRNALAKAELPNE